MRWHINQEGPRYDSRQFFCGIYSYVSCHPRLNVCVVDTLLYGSVHVLHHALQQVSTLNDTVCSRREGIEDRCDYYIQQYCRHLKPFLRTMKSKTRCVHDGVRDATASVSQAGRMNSPPVFVLEQQRAT